MPKRSLSNGCPISRWPCPNIENARAFSSVFKNQYLNNSCCKDVTGIEYASVLKNVYAIVAGICHGMKYGDNFLAVFICNAIEEMRNFLNAVHGLERDVTDSVYLGDLLVTAILASAGTVRSGP